MSANLFDPLTEFVGRRALVTGGSRGIGAAVAQRLLDGGAAVAVTARSHTADTPVDAVFIAGDLRSADGASAVADAAVHELGGLDILINNAASARPHVGGVTTIPDQEWLDSLDINFLSAVRVTHAALPALRKSDGAAIVNVSSGGRHTTARTDPSLRRRQGRVERLHVGTGSRVEPPGHPGQHRHARAGAVSRRHRDPPDARRCRGD